MNECFVHRISGISFTFRAQRDGRSYTKLEWLFYRIFLFTLCAQRDRRSYTSTTDQCGARSGSPQLFNKLKFCSYFNKFIFVFVKSRAKKTLHQRTHSNTYPLNFIFKCRLAIKLFKSGTKLQLLPQHYKPVFF